MHPDQTPPAVGDRLPDVELVDHHGRTVGLGDLTRPRGLARRVGFAGPPLVVLTGRGWFCPRDRAHLRSLVARQDELLLGAVALVYVAVQPPEVQAAFRAGLGADWTFCADTARVTARRWGLLDPTEGEYRDVLRPYGFVCDPDLVVRAAYDGWWLTGRPTVDELVRDVRRIRTGWPGGRYEDWTDDSVTALRVPAGVWADGVEPPGRIVRRDVTGTITAFDRRTGEGTVTTAGGAKLFFHFTAIPGSGYRSPDVGAAVTVDVVDHPSGPLATNVRI